jgi:hypothetical protein
MAQRRRGLLDRLCDVHHERTSGDPASPCDPVSERAKWDPQRPGSPLVALQAEHALCRCQRAKTGKNREGSPRQSGGRQTFVLYLARTSSAGEVGGTGTGEAVDASAAIGVAGVLASCTGARCGMRRWAAPTWSHAGANNRNAAQNAASARGISIPAVPNHAAPIPTGHMTPTPFGLGAKASAANIDRKSTTRSTFR